MTSEHKGAVTFAASALANTFWMAGTLVAISLMATAANANLIMDGDFNFGPAPDLAQQYYINYGTSLPGGYWNVLDNNVDIVGPGLTPYGMISPSGQCCVVDLVGYGTTGGIDQKFTPTVSGTYKLTFDYSNNFYSTIFASAAVEIGTTAGGNSILDGMVKHSDATFANMGWDEYIAYVNLTGGTSYYLSLDTIFGANSGGVVVTNFDMAAAPLPSTWTMLIAGFLGLGYFACRGTKNRAGASAAA
jgi:hypothetical protein